MGVCKEMDEESKLECARTLLAHFGIGRFLRDRIVPRAVLFFLGERGTVYN
jgi:hypothetical protein